jgi:hypothetical protein
VAAELRRIAPEHRAEKSIRIQAHNLENCCKQFMVKQCEDCDTRYHTAIKCNSRLCERCQRIKMIDFYKQVRAMIDDVRKTAPSDYRPMQLTLTITTKRFGNDMPCRKDIQRLYRESAELLTEFFGKWQVNRSKSGRLVETKRRKGIGIGTERRIWRGCGWLAIPEVGADNNNLHIHALVFGPYYSQARIKERWQKITGDSHGVDIRCKPAKECVAYIMKYICKPPKSDSYTRLASWAVSISGTRRIRTGGIFYGRIRKHKLPKVTCSCVICNGRLHMHSISTGLIDSLPMWEAQKDPAAYITSHQARGTPNLWLADGYTARDLPN